MMTMTIYFFSPERRRILYTHHSFHPYRRKYDVFFSITYDFLGKEEEEEEKKEDKKKRREEERRL